MSSKVSTIRIVIRFAVAVIALSAAFFGSAGTFSWPEAWVYMIVQFSFSAVLTLWLKQHNPDLLNERMIFLKKSAKVWDKVIVLICTVVCVPYLVLPGLDAVRYHWSNVPLPVKVTGFIGIFVSFVLIFLVMRENTYLWRVVEIQKERGHKVITTGPYQYVRHPMYVGVIIMFICLPLALGSLLALIPGTALTALIIIRIYLEEKMLLAELQGYKTYMDRVRYRLIPGIW